MNNKFNISDKVRLTEKPTYDYQIQCKKMIVSEIRPERENPIGIPDDAGHMWWIDEESLELIEPNTIEEEDKKNHILTYEFSFDTPLVDNMVGNIYAISKDILCKNFIDSLNAHMIHSLRMGTFEIPDIKWEYMNVEEMVIEEDTQGKPPLGIKPKYIWEIDYSKGLEILRESYIKVHLPKRIKSLKEAIDRYLKEGIVIPSEWIEEYNEHISTNE